MKNIFRLTKKAAKWYFERTKDNNFMTPSGMIPYNFYRKYNEVR